MRNKMKISLYSFIQMHYTQTHTIIINEMSFKTCDNGPYSFIVVMYDVLG
jgi:hypothetical protein